MTTITAAKTVGVRFPASQQLDGSDAMDPDPDYSAAYLSLATVADDGLVGEPVEDLLADMGATYRRFGYDPHLRWLGPEKGIVDGRHVAPAAPGAGTEMAASSLEEYRYRGEEAS